MSISPAQPDVLPGRITRSQRARVLDFFSVAASVPETRALVVEVEEVLAGREPEPLLSPLPLPRVRRSLGQPVTPLPVAPLAMTPLPVAPLAMTPLPVAPLAVTPLPVAPRTPFRVVQARARGTVTHPMTPRPAGTPSFWRLVASWQTVTPPRPGSMAGILNSTIDLTDSPGPCHPEVGK